MHTETLAQILKKQAVTELEKSVADNGQVLKQSAKNLIYHCIGQSTAKPNATQEIQSRGLGVFVSSRVVEMQPSRHRLCVILNYKNVEYTFDKVFEFPIKK